MRDDLDLDLCTAALLADLAALDGGAADRAAHLFSALESAEWLFDRGGGPLGLDTVTSLKTELAREIGGAP